MSINQISISSWNQGYYSGGEVYDGSTSHISSDRITIDPVIHSIKFTTSPVELDYWHKLQDDSWEIYDTQPYQQGTVSVYLLDENENVLYNGSPAYDVEVNLDNYPTAKYIIIGASEDRGTVNRNIMARDPTSSDAQSTWYTMHSVITYTYEAYNWYMTEDEELANDYMPNEVAEYTTPIPFASWTIAPSVNSGFPITGAFEPTPTLDTIPLPNSQWRITEGYNDGFLFNMLLPNILYIPPPEPDIPECANWLSHWFIRKEDMDLNRESVMGYISKKSDRSFQPGNFKRLPHWNNSVQELNNQYYEMIGEDENDGRIRLERGDS